ncbi:MAG: AraC family transcriptional regulator [Paenibacillus sp.]|nr:AraC family transcriptional regulator [Paenibacillus sp.]
MEFPGEINLWVTDMSLVVFRQPDPGWRIQSPVKLIHHTIAFAVDGQSDYHIHGRPYHVEKGDLLFLPTRTERVGKSNPDDPWAFYVVQFDCVFADPESEERFYRLDNVIRGATYAQTLSLYKTLDREWTAKRPGYLLKCRSLITEIVCTLVRSLELTGENARYTEIVDAILDRMAENYERNYSVEEICRITGYSPSHIQLLFKRMTGRTIIQYQNEIKVYKARDLLQHGNCNVTEAAYQVGFNDVNHFGRQFKKITGRSPSEYMKRI